MRSPQSLFISATVPIRPRLVPGLSRLPPAWPIQVAGDPSTNILNGLESLLSLAEKACCLPSSAFLSSFSFNVQTLVAFLSQEVAAEVKTYFEEQLVSMLFLDRAIRSLRRRQLFFAVGELSPCNDVLCPARQKDAPAGFVQTKMG